MSRASTLAVRHEDELLGLEAAMAEIQAHLRESVREPPPGAGFYLLLRIQRQLRKRYYAFWRKDEAAS